MLEPEIGLLLRERVSDCPKGGKFEPKEALSFYVFVTTGIIGKLYQRLGWN